MPIGPVPAKSAIHAVSDELRPTVPVRRRSITTVRGDDIGKLYKPDTAIPAGTETLSLRLAIQLAESLESLVQLPDFLLNLWSLRRDGLVDHSAEFEKCVNIHRFQLSHLAGIARNRLLASEPDASTSSNLQTARRLVAVTTPPGCSSTFLAFLAFLGLSHHASF